MNVIYRFANENDSLQMAYVSAYSWMETYSYILPKEYLENKIKNIEESSKKIKKFLIEHPNYLVALVDDKIVGICEYEGLKDNKRSDYAHLGALYVLKEYQGYGIGKELLKKAIKGLIDMGYNKMYLECICGNSSINFYKKYDGIIKEKTKYLIPNAGNYDVHVVEFLDIKKIYAKI